VDWLGLGLLAFFMVMLISGLHALATARSAPQAAIVPLVLAAIAFTALLWAETRNRRPLLDFGLFSVNADSKVPKCAEVKFPSRRG